MLQISMFSDHTKGNPICDVYFLTPLQWMKNELERRRPDGQLLCPGCDRKVGSYNWRLVSCACEAQTFLGFKLATACVIRSDLPISYKLTTLTDS